MVTQTKQDYNKNLISFSREKLLAIEYYLKKKKVTRVTAIQAKKSLMDLFALEKYKDDTIVNTYAINKDNVYLLTQEHCDDIIDILNPPESYAERDNPSRLISSRKNIDKCLQSSLMNLPQLLDNKTLGGIIYSAKRYAKTKVSTQHTESTKVGLILQSSAYKFVGDCIIDIIFSLYFKPFLVENQQIPTLVSLYNALKDQNDLKVLKAFDQHLLKSIINLCKNNYTEKLVGYSPKVDIETRSTLIVDFQDKWDLLIEINNRPSINRIIELGKCILTNDNEFIRSQEHPNYFDVYNVEKPLPLISMHQEYNYLPLLNNSDTIDTEYNGMYTRPIFREEFIYKYYLDPFETKVCIDLCLDRYDSEEDKELFLLYYYGPKIEIKQTLEQLKKTYPEKASILYNFMFDFNTNKLDEMEDFIKQFVDDVKKHKKEQQEMDRKTVQNIKLLTKFYQQIKSKKYTITNMISLLQIYPKFGYYLSHSFTSYTGRRFPVSTGLDVLYKPIRNLCRVLDLADNPEEVITHLKDKITVIDHHVPYIQDEETMVKPLVKYSLKRYEHYHDQKNDENIGVNVYLKDYYLARLIKNDEKIKELNLTEFNKNNIKLLVFKMNMDVYKAVRYLIAKHSIKNNKSFTMHVDAIASGSQMTSLCLKSRKGAGFCGITEPDNGLKPDIYLHIIDCLEKQINEFKAISLLNDNINDDYIQKNTWLFKCSSKLNIDHKKILNEFIDFYIKFNSILTNRDLWKSIVMPQQYGMTAYAMRKVLREALINKLEHYPFDKMLIFVGVLVSWFNDIMQKEIPMTDLYLKTFKEIKNTIKVSKIKHEKDQKKALIKEAYKIKPIKFSTNSYSWEYQVFKLKSHKIKLKGQQMKLYIKTNQIHLDKAFTSLPPILTHAIDANIIHNVVREAFAFQYNVSTIHDCFLVSSNYIICLLDDVRNAYVSVYNQDLFTKFIIMNNFDTKYLKVVRDESHPDYLRPEDIIIISKKGLFKFLT